MAAQSSPIKSSARDAEPAERPSLTLKRRFNAAPEKVYAAWADPQRLVQWFGPASVKEGSVKAEIDLRVPSQQLAEEMTHWFLGFPR